MPIAQSQNRRSSFVCRSVLERYYTCYTTSNHQTIHVHSNGVCVLGVCRSHPLLHSGRAIRSIRYRSNDAKNLLENSVHGKKKAGAVFLLPREWVATVELEGGEEEASSLRPSCFYTHR